MALCRALTIVLCLPDGVGRAPEARKYEEQRQLAGVRLPQQEGDDARQVGHGTCERGKGLLSDTLLQDESSDHLLPGGNGFLK